jgi:hypothetical protein
MANTTYTVLNKNGSYDGDMVVRQYTDVTINAGDTVTVDQPCRGLLIYVQGNCTINGTLSMKSKGALADPTASGGSDSNATQGDGLRLPFKTSGGSDTLTSANTLFNGCGTVARTVIANHPSISSNGTILQVTRLGAGDTDTTDGNATSTGNTVADAGTSGTNHTGGGGQGSAGYETNSGDAGMGRSGTCFSGGAGGGGGNSTGGHAGKNAYAYGGQGGQGRTNHTAQVTSGQGNPEGATPYIGGGTGGAVIVDSGETGIGGVIWLIVGGNLTIGASGKITCKGSQADGIDGNGYNWLTTGGGSGGGAVRIAYKGTFTNNGSIDVAGGLGGQMTDIGNGQYAGTGGTGGSGSSVTLQVS